MEHLRFRNLGVRALPLSRLVFAPLGTTVFPPTGGIMLGQQFVVSTDGPQAISDSTWTQITNDGAGADSFNTLPGSLGWDTVTNTIDMSTLIPQRDMINLTVACAFTTSFNETVVSMRRRYGTDEVIFDLPAFDAGAGTYTFQIPLMDPILDGYPGSPGYLEMMASAPGVSVVVVNLFVIVLRGP